MNHGDQPETDAPPDIAASGDVSTTGHSTHDVQAADAHAGHGPADTSDQPTLVPTTWTQLVFPAIILLFVAVLVAGPVVNAFSSKPAAAPPAAVPAVAVTSAWESSDSMENAVHDDLGFETTEADEESSSAASADSESEY